MGRKRFLHKPFGLSLTSEILQQRNDDTFGDIDNVHVIADDLISAGKDEQKHDTALLAVMERARAKDVKFSRDKLQYKIKQVKYIGHLIGENGQQPDPANDQASGAIHSRRVGYHCTSKRAAQVRRHLAMVRAA